MSKPCSLTPHLRHPVPPAVCPPGSPRSALCSRTRHRSAPFPTQWSRRARSSSGQPDAATEASGSAVCLRPMPSLSGCSRCSAGEGSRGCREPRVPCSSPALSPSAGPELTGQLCPTPVPLVRRPRFASGPVGGSGGETESVLGQFPESSCLTLGPAETAPTRLSQSGSPGSTHLSGPWPAGPKTLPQKGREVAPGGRPNALGS